MYLPQVYNVHTLNTEMETQHEIPLPNVKNAVLIKVIEFLRYHDDEPMYEIEKVWIFHVHSYI